MKRIGIFAFYDEQGIVDEFKQYLLESMIPYLSELVIVINGAIQEDALRKWKETYRYVFVRENMGYDSGAYKDVLLGKYAEIDWGEWDEIILFNDTFYGPLFSWDEMFRTMENMDVDFWGLIRDPEKMAKRPDCSNMAVEEHIQSYFLAIKKNMFISKFWNIFWKELEYPTVYWEAVERFEYAFTPYFVKRGFQFATWLDICGGEKYIKRGIITYMVAGYDIVKECRFPIIKWRVMSPSFYKNMTALLEYVEHETDYDKMLILKHLERMENRIRPFSMARLEEFVGNRDKVYVFGRGTYGKGLEDCFRAKGWNWGGFVVSNPKNEDEIGVYDLNLDEEDGIVVALNEGNANEVRTLLESRFSSAQILYPVGYN